MRQEVERDVEDGRELAPTVWRPVAEPVRFQVSRGMAELFARHGVADVKAMLDDLAAVGELTVCVERGATDTRPVVAVVEVADGQNQDR